MSDYIEKWTPEDPEFWRKTGSKIAWQTLIITTLSLTISFCTWFMMSAMVVRIPKIGFKFDTMQLFWLAAMPGLAGGSLRIIHTFLIPMYGTRKVVTISTILKLIPCIGLGLAVCDPTTPFWVFMVLAFSAGFGGGDFSSFMPSTSLFFPKRLQGSALGIQAGIGNFGVCIAQFITPWIIGFAIGGTLLGGPQKFVAKPAKAPAPVATQAATPAPAPVTLAPSSPVPAPSVPPAPVVKDIWLQNAAYWYVPFVIVFTIAAWFMLKSVPVNASFKEQLDIFGNKHTWFCTITYVMTFGSFSGFSAAFPLLIKEVYGAFPDAPDPLKYAFYGPLIGSVMRVIFGFIADKTGGAILTHISGLGLLIVAAAMPFLGVLTPTSLDSFPLFVGLMLALFFFTGIGNASTFRQYPIVFSHSPRQGAGVLGWTAAVAAYGPFIFSTAIGKSITGMGSARPFFFGAAAFYLFGTAINWWYYTRKGCEKPC